MSEHFSDDAIVGRLQRLVSGTGSGQSTWTPAGGRSVDGRVVLDSLDGDMEAVRSSTSLAHRQVVAEAGGLVVALDVTPVERANDLSVDSDAALLAVRGQVLAGVTGAAVVQFISADGVEGGLAVVDDLGEFEVEIEAGEWLLVIADDEIDASLAVTLG